MAQWLPQNSGTTKQLKSVYFTNVDTGYAVGHNDTGDGGIILKTNNGGIDWETLMVEDTLKFNLFFLSITISVMWLVEVIPKQLDFHQSFLKLQMEERLGQ